MPPKIRSPYVDWETFYQITGFTWVPSAHTHIKSAITDLPWSWGDVSKAGSNLTDLVTRQHAGLTDILANQHHPQSHTLASHSTKPHSALTDVLENQHHNKLHSMTGVAHSVAGLTIGWVLRATGAATFSWGFLTKLGTINTGVWQGSPIANAYIAGIDQDLLQASNVQHASMLLNNTGLRLFDTNASHYLTIKPGSDLSANRILTLITGDLARTITLSGNPTLADWFNQGVKTTSNPLFNSVYFNKAGVAYYKNVEHFYSGSSTVTGTMKIEMPKTWSNTMQKIIIHGFDYGAMGQWSVEISGYNYLPTTQWVNCHAEIHGYAPFSSVRLAHDGTHCCLLLGILATEWHYPQVVIAEFIASFGGITGWETGWVISIIDNEGAIGSIVTPTVETWIKGRLCMTALTDGYVPYHVSDALGLDDSPIRIDGANVGIGKVPTCALDVNGTIKATLLQGNLHWDYITNEPSYYPPEYHYHVGKDIISLHLVDLNDVEADDIFDVLNTADINGQGNYDWWGTWTTSHGGAGCSANIVVLAGDDKMLRLTDSATGASWAGAYLQADVGHPLVTGVVNVKLRQSATNKKTVMYFKVLGGANRIDVIFDSDGNIKLGAGGAGQTCQAYAANTWYTIRLHWDFVACAVVIFIDNVHKKRLEMLTKDYVDRIGFITDTATESYTFDVNNLRLFNLTI